jgi:hypothetical protein
MARVQNLATQAHVSDADLMERFAQNHPKSVSLEAARLYIKEHATPERLQRYRDLLDRSLRLLQDGKPQ